MPYQGTNKKTSYEKHITTIKNIYDILNSFDDVYDKIVNACNDWDLEKAYKEADDYINSFEPIYDKILSKWDEQKIHKYSEIISNIFLKQFRMFRPRCYLLSHCNDISYEEKINKLNDIFEKIKSLRKKFNNHRMYVNTAIWGTTKDKIIKRNDIRNFFKEFNINNYQNCTRNEIEGIKCKFYKYINYAESSNFPIEEHINLLRIFLEFLEAHNLDSDAKSIQEQITIKEIEKMILDNIEYEKKKKKKKKKRDKEKRKEIKKK